MGASKWWPQLQPKLGGIPAELALGWMAVESGGKLNDDTVTKKNREVGLYQLDNGERPKVGFTDVDRLLSDADYSLDAGIALINAYAQDALGYDGVTAGSELQWRVAKLLHSGGKATVDAMWAEMRANESLPADWGEVVGYFPPPLLGVHNDQDKRVFDAVKASTGDGHYASKAIERTNKAWDAGAVLAAPLGFDLFAPIMVAIGSVTPDTKWWPMILAGVGLPLILWWFYRGEKR